MINGQEAGERGLKAWGKVNQVSYEDICALGKTGIIPYETLQCFPHKDLTRAARQLHQSQPSDSF